jgi:hypothetical protein
VACTSYILPGNTKNPVSTGTAKATSRAISSFAKIQKMPVETRKVAIKYNLAKYKYINVTKAELILL